jgi:hypothetical protein
MIFLDNSNFIVSAEVFDALVTDWLETCTTIVEHNLLEIEQFVQSNRTGKSSISGGHFPTTINVYFPGEIEWKCQWRRFSLCWDQDQRPEYLLRRLGTFSTDIDSGGG